MFKPPTSDEWAWRYWKARGDRAVKMRLILTGKLLATRWATLHQTRRALGLHAMLLKPKDDKGRQRLTRRLVTLHQAEGRWVTATQRLGARIDRQTG